MQIPQPFSEFYGFLPPILEGLSFKFFQEVGPKKLTFFRRGGASNGPQVLASLNGVQ